MATYFLCMYVYVCLCVSVCTVFWLCVAVIVVVVIFVVVVVVVVVRMLSIAFHCENYHLRCAIIGGYISPFIHLLSFWQQRFYSNNGLDSLLSRCIFHIWIIGRLGVHQINPQHIVSQRFDIEMKYISILPSILKTHIHKHKRIIYRQWILKFGQFLCGWAAGGLGVD